MWYQASPRQRLARPSAQRSATTETLCVERASIVADLWPKIRRFSALSADLKKYYISITYQWRRGWDSNPRYGCPYTRFPGVRLRPLGHPSSSFRNGADHSKAGRVRQGARPLKNRLFSAKNRDSRADGARKQSGHSRVGEGATVARRSRRVNAACSFSRPGTRDCPMQGGPRTWPLRARRFMKTPKN